MENPNNASRENIRNLQGELKDQSVEAIEGGLASPTTLGLEDPEIRKAFVNHLNSLSIEELNNYATDLEEAEKELNEAFIEFRNIQTSETRVKAEIAYNNFLKILFRSSKPAAVLSFYPTLIGAGTGNMNVFIPSAIVFFLSAISAAISGSKMIDNEDILNNSSPEVSERHAALERASENISKIASMIESQKSLLTGK